MVRYFGLFLIISFLISSCDNDTVIGEDLLNEEELGTSATEDFELTMSTIVGEEIYGAPIYPNSSFNIRPYSIGEINDPVFGVYGSELYVTFFRPSLPDFTNTVLDSAVLIMTYDTLSLYGDPEAMHTLEVFEVEEDFADRDSILSDEEILTATNPLGVLNFVPAPNDSLTIIDRNDPDSTFLIGPQIRVPFNTPEGISYAERLMTDTTALESNEALLEAFKGLKFVSNSGGSAMLGVRIGGSSVGNLALYYTKDDTIKRTFAFSFRDPTFLHTEHDFSQGDIQQFLDNPDLGDSLCFVQSLRGVDTKVVFPDLSQFAGDVINSAILTVTVKDENRENFAEPFQLIADITEDGERRSIDDLTLFGNSVDGSFEIFRGVPVEVDSDGELLTQYSFNITNYAQRIVKEGLVEPDMIIYPWFRENNARNAVFFGPGSSKYPAKLRITYTDL